MWFFLRGKMRNINALQNIKNFISTMKTKYKFNAMDEVCIIERSVPTP